MALTWTHVMKPCKQHHEAGPHMQFSRNEKERPSQEQLAEGSGEGDTQCEA